MNKVMLIGLSIVASISVNHANAALLAAGDSVVISGTTAAVQPELAGSVINDNFILDTLSPSGNNHFPMGIQVQNRVLQSTMTGDMIFGPRIVPALNLTTGNFLIDRVVMSGFSDYILDVNYRTDGLGDRGPNLASRSADGDELSFDFFFPVVLPNLFPNPIEESYFFSISSNATAYSNTGSMSIFGRHLSYPAEIFEFNYTGMAVPTLAQVPEPSSFSLFIVILGYIAFYKKAALSERMGRIKR